MTRPPFVPPVRHAEAPKPRAFSYVLTRYMGSKGANLYPYRFVPVK